MQKQFLLILALSTFFYYLDSEAQTNPPAQVDSIDSKAFTDWFTLTDLLKSKNIDASYVDWHQIEPMCLPLKTEDSEIAYNKCRYEKAVLRQQFLNDRDTCNRQSVLKLPDSLKQNPFVSTVTITDSDGKVRTIQKTVPPYSDIDLRNARSSFYMDCMTGYGWSSPNDWGSGKRQ